MRHNFIIRGIIDAMNPIQEFTNSKKQELHIVADKTGEYEDERDEFFSVDFWNDKGIEKLLDFTEGDHVELTVVATGNKYNDRVFNNLRGMKIERI